MSMSTRSFFTAALVLLLLGTARPAQAGPPLLCHPFDIGSAASLPWSGATSWFEGSRDYQVVNLVADTEALLSGATPVIVRMETLRRASIYASRDPKIATALLERLSARANTSRTAGRPDALALLDVAYVTEALRQIAMIGGVDGFKSSARAIGELVRDRDGSRDIAASLAARPDDPALEFAAALIAAGKDRSAYLAHAQRARAGAPRDPLLARNLKHLS